jgi:hypothetical protein
MKKIIKLVFGLVFSLGFLATANAQTDSAAAPDDIVCVQVDDNVFECALMDKNSMDAEPNQQQDLFNEGTIPAPSINEGDQNIPEKKEYNEQEMNKQQPMKEDDQGKKLEDPSLKENDQTIEEDNNTSEGNWVEGEMNKKDNGKAGTNKEAAEPEIKVKC